MPQSSPTRGPALDVPHEGVPPLSDNHKSATTDDQIWLSAKLFQIRSSKSEILNFKEREIEDAQKIEKESQEKYQYKIYAIWLVQI